MPKEFEGFDSERYRDDLLLKRHRETCAWFGQTNATDSGLGMKISQFFGSVEDLDVARVSCHRLFPNIFLMMHATLSGENI